MLLDSDAYMPSRLELFRGESIRESTWESTRESTPIRYRLDISTRYNRYRLDMTRYSIDSIYVPNRLDTSNESVRESTRESTRKSTRIYISESTRIFNERVDSRVNLGVDSRFDSDMISTRYIDSI